MRTDNRKAELERLLSLVAKIVGYVINGSVRSEIDDQNAIELKRHHEESIDFSLDIR
jgi:hypothetical protein